IVLISHAPDEVERLADQVVFMQAGLAQAPLPLLEALARPDSPLFADTGPVSVLQGALSQADSEGYADFVNGPVRLQLSSNCSEAQFNVRLRVLARDVSLALDDPVRISIQNHLPATVRQLHEQDRGRVLVETELADGQTLLAELTVTSVQRLALEPG